MRFEIILVAFLNAGYEVLANPLFARGDCSKGALACCSGESFNEKIDSDLCHYIDDRSQCFDSFACCKGSEVSPIGCLKRKITNVLLGLHQSGLLLRCHFLIFFLEELARQGDQTPDRRF